MPSRAKFDVKPAAPESFGAAQFDRVLSTTPLDTWSKRVERQRATNGKMGRAYSEDQKVHVKTLLEQGRDEETIEKETGVSDRTIRRWKLELEKTGRIGKVGRSHVMAVVFVGANDVLQPPESRTGRHRVLSPEIEAVSRSV